MEESKSASDCGCSNRSFILPITQLQVISFRLRSTILILLLITSLVWFCVRAGQRDKTPLIYLLKLMLLCMNKLQFTTNVDLNLDQLLTSSLYAESRLEIDVSYAILRVVGFNFSGSMINIIN